MRRSAFITAALAAASIGALPRAALAETVHVQLTSYEEVPALSTAAGGTFRAFINDAAGTIRYTLSYSGLEGDVRQAHIHFGQRSVNAGISIWLCETSFTEANRIAAGSPDVPTCPQSGTVEFTVGMNHVIGPAGQGIAAGEFAEIVRAIRAGRAYANVHSTKFPGGEIRGQINDDNQRDD